MFFPEVYREKRRSSSQRLRAFSDQFSSSFIMSKQQPLLIVHSNYLRRDRLEKKEICRDIAKEKRRRGNRSRERERERRRERERDRRREGDRSFGKHSHVKSPVSSRTYLPSISTRISNLINRETGKLERCSSIDDGITSSHG